MESVLENKGAPGNGLTDTVSPEEVEPLKNKKKINAYREEMMDIGPDGDEDRHSKGSGQGFLERWAYKCRLSPKRGLLYLIVAFIIILLLFVILICLAAAWPHHLSRNTCTTPQCHLFSAKILAGLNETSPPCEDFWEFGCGGWLSSHPLPKFRGYWSEDDVQQFKLKEKLRNMINILPFSDESSAVEMKVKRFYQTCMALEYVENEQEKPLRRIILQLGGWQVFRTFRQNEFDFNRVFRKLQGEWRISPFFKIQVVLDPQGPSRNIIKISPSGLSLPDRSYYFKHEDPLVMGWADCPKRRCNDQYLSSLHKFYKEQRKSMAAAFRTYAKDVIQLLGATSNVASQFADEIFHFEKRIAEITPDPLTLRDPIIASKKINVARLKSQSNSIFWSDLLKALFPQANINDLTEILVESEQYLVDISSIISTTDKGNLNNYLMWHFTHQYLPYLSKQYQDVYEIYRKEAIGTLSAAPRWEFCIDETLKIFPHALNAMLADNCEDRGNKTLKIESMFEAMKETLRERFENGVKYNETMKEFALDKLRLMSIQVGTPFTNRTILNDMYFALDFQKYELFTNIQYATDFARSQTQRQLVAPTKDSRLLQALGESLFKIQYVPSLNKLVVPETLLQREVLLLDNTHLPLIYGSVGVELAEGIARAYGLEQGLYWASGALMKESDPKAQETRNLVEAKRSCLASFFTTIRLDDEDYIERTSLDSTLHLGGVQIAFDTLQSVAGSYVSLPSLQRFSPNAIFFISYVQSQCSTHTLLYHDMEHVTFTSLSHDHRTRGVLRQLVPFTNAMGCTSRTEMFADFTCGYVI